MQNRKQGDFSIKPKESLPGIKDVKNQKPKAKSYYAKRKKNEKEKKIIARDGYEIGNKR